jgi:PAS domain S-box-containing protein
MKSPLATPERERLHALASYEILDTPREQAFDDLTMLASHICQTPMAAIALVDETRQWFKSAVGLGAVSESPRDHSFCDYVILEGDVVVVSDARADGRFRGNPFVPSGAEVRFLAGAPLVTGEGLALGALCVADTNPRVLDAERATLLRALARQVVSRMEQRRKLAELTRTIAQRDKAQEELDHFFNLSLDMLCVADFDYKFKRINPAWANTLGYSEEELLRRPYLDFVHPDDVAATVGAADNLEDGTDLFSFENRYRCADGSYKWLHWTATAAIAEGRIYAAARDITGRRHAEEALRRYANEIDEAKRAEEANAARLSELVGQLDRATRRTEEATRAKGEFLANMSHEIRTPMNAIIGMTELVLGSELSAEQRDYLETVKDSADSLLDLLNDILDFSKIEAGRLDFEAIPFSLRDTVGATTKLLATRAREKGLELATQVDADVPDALIGDPKRLRQILVNLLGNAVKFTDHGGILMQVKKSQLTNDAEVAVAAEHDEVRLHFSVTDSGVGIDNEKKELIFQAFEQGDTSVARTHGGTGLGLAISSQLAAMMGGRLWLESSSEEGSSFQFEAVFTITTDEAVERVPRASAPAHELVSTGTLHILVAEDNVVNRALVTRLLAREGYTVDVVENGREALEALETPGRFDLVLMDVRMPDVDGLEATLAIRAAEAATGAHIPILALTADAAPEDRQRCLEAGMDDYISKPVRANELLAIVERTATRFSLARRVPAPASEPRDELDEGALLAGVRGDRALLLELIALFREDASGMLADMEQAISREDVRALATSAHAFVGSLGNFVNEGAYETARELERLARAGQLQDCVPVFTTLVDQTRRLELQLSAFADREA